LFFGLFCMEAAKYGAAAAVASGVSGLKHRRHGFVHGV